MKEILFVIWLAFVFIDLLYFAVIVLVAAKRFKEMYPNKKTRKPSPGKLVMSCMTILFTSIIPIIHIAFGCVYMFYYDTIINKTIKTLIDNIE